VIGHRLHRLVCPCCCTSTCAPLASELEATRYGHRLSALVSLLGSAFPLSFSNTQALLDQLLGVEISIGAIAAIELLGSTFSGIVVSVRFSAYNHFPLEQRQLCWAYLIRDLTAIRGRQGVSGEIGAQVLALQQQLYRFAEPSGYDQWQQWKSGTIDWPQLQQGRRQIHQSFEATLQRVVVLGFERGERTPWAKTVHPCRQLLQRIEALWTYLEIQGFEHTNNAAERALRQSMIQRKITARESSPPAAPSGAAACSRSQPSCGIRAGIPGSSWSRPGSPITAVA
jgi:hypothetical protein